LNKCPLGKNRRIEKRREEKRREEKKRKEEEIVEALH